MTYSDPLYLGKNLATIILTILWPKSMIRYLSLWLFGVSGNFDSKEKGLKFFKDQKPKCYTTL